MIFIKYQSIYDFYFYINNKIFGLNFQRSIGDWGLGIGDWGLGIGDWAQSPIPNPQSPIPNPQSPYEMKLFIYNKLVIYFSFKINNKNY